MDKLEPITTMPRQLVTVETIRETCEQIYNDFRNATHYDTVALMMMAWNKGYALGRATAFEESLEAIRKPAPTDDDRSIMDVARELKAACDHFDAIKQDRHTQAKETNGAERVRWIR